MIADKPTQIKRLEICYRCEDLSKGVLIPFVKRSGRYIGLPFGKGGQCKHCACIMKYKVQLTESKCPINKW